MGASFNVMSFQGTVNEVSKRWNACVEEAQHCCGHAGNYTGSISELGKGFNDTGKILKDRDEAERYIEEHHQKWDRAMAVRYRKQGGLTKGSANKKAKLQADVERAVCDLDTLKTNLFNVIKNAKSKTIGCTKCESKVNRSYLRDTRCPVCGTDLWSKTAIERMNRAEAKICKAKEKLRNYKPKTSASAKTEMWLIGGWCSE